MFLVSDTNLTLAFAVAAGLAAVVALIALIMLARTAGARKSLANRLSQLERGADHTERRMFTILNSIPVALVETDTTGRFVFANKAAHTLLGRKDAELIGLRFHSATWGITYPDGKLIPPDLLPAARALRGQTVRGFHHLIVNPNSRKRILVSVTAMPVTNDLGEVIGSTAAMVETEGLAVAQTELEPVAPATPWGDIPGQMLLALDAAGKVKEINRVGAYMLGREASEMEGKDWFGFLPEEDRAAAREQFKAQIEGGADMAVWDESTVQAADGSTRRFAWRSEVQRDANGKATALLAAGREAAAPAPEPEPVPVVPADTRFASLAEASEDALWSADVESGKLTFVSPAFTRLYGFSFQEMEADVAPWMACVEADDRPAVQSAWEAAVAGEPRTVEFGFVRPNETEPLTVRDRLFPIRDSEGRITGVGGAARDITGEGAELHESKAALGGLEAELQETRATLAGLGAELHESRAAASSLDAELQESRAALSSLDAELQESKAALSRLEAELQETKATESGRDAELDESKAILAGLSGAPGVYAGVMESLGDDFRYAAANATTEALFGRTVEGATARELGFTSEEIAGWVAIIEGAETSGSATVIEHPFQVGGRETGWALGAYAPLPRSAEGRARASFVAVDISERRRGEAALRDAESRARSLAEAAPQLVWSCTASGWCDYLSPRWVEYTGVPAERHHGLGWQDAVHPEDRAATAAAWNACMAGDCDYDVDYRLRAADGSYRWFRARCTAQRDETGQVVRWFGASTDVTEIVEAKGLLEQRVAERTAELERSLEDHRRTEAALTQAQRLETVGRLTGGVAHDFNNLLTVMIGALDIIQRHADKADRVRRLSEAALTAGRRGERLTRQLLAFSRRQEFQLETLDLSRLIGGFEPLIRRALGEAVPFSLEVPNDLGFARIDPVQFEAALLNLIVNAKDAVENGGSVSLRADKVRLQPQQLAGLDGGDYLRVAVVDTGVGMTTEVAARALEPFFTTKEVGKGTGLGLAQVYGFARQSGGQVQVESELGAGAAISVFLPVADAEAEPAAPAEPVELRLVEPGMTVLLVEDDEGVRQVAESLLIELGCSVVTADDGPEALRMLERNDSKVDLLLTDVVMPGGMSGVELAQTARQTHPELKVLLSTGYAGERLDEAANQGWSVLRKPYQAEELSQAVKEALVS